MPVHNADIAVLFERYADLLEIAAANPYRIRAYRNAARVVRDHPHSMADLVRQGADLAELPAIGADLAHKIETIVNTGHLPQLEAEESRVPRALVELLQVTGLGPKKVRRLHEELGITNLDDLRRAVASGSIKTLKGFGEKTERLIGNGLVALLAADRRIPLAQAEIYAQALLDYLRRNAAVKDAIVAGSYRRRRDTVGDLDVLVCAPRGSGITEYFLQYDEIAHVAASGPTRAAVTLRCGLSVDLRVVAPGCYGAALHYFTGSKAHVVAVRRRAGARGLKINEYGVYRGQRRIAGRTEQEVYASVALPYVEPELREDSGELDAAERDSLPRLVCLGDIRGDLHCHTNATDGTAALDAMVAAAAARGYEYISINDHTRHMTVAHGLDAKRLLAQIRAIDALNATRDDIVILKSAEVDILEDGTLDLPDSVLRQLDFTVCAIHHKFDLPERKQTERILRAMDNPLFTILAHPTGRLLGRRDAYRVDLAGLMRGAVERGCHMEVNARPERLDLSGEACRMARELGLKLAISTDAHSTGDFDLIRFGVDQARRGWLQKQDVLNTLKLKELRRLLRRA